mgnify:FL=1
MNTELLTCIYFYYSTIMEVCIVNRVIKKLNITIIIGILAVWVSGSLFHFVYDWTGRNTFVGLFFPI